MSKLDTHPPTLPVGSQTNLRESGDLRSQGECLCPPFCLRPLLCKHLSLPPLPDPWSGPEPHPPRPVS